MSKGSQESDGSASEHDSRTRGAGTAFWCAAAAVLVLAVFAAFGPALDASFVNWDDEANLLENDEFRGLGATHIEWMFTHAYGGPYMPLTWLSLAVDHALWGLSPGLEAPEAPLFHRTSVFLHALGALAFLALARRVLALVQPTASPHARGFAALVAALLFAVHPLRVESVAWVTERRDVLSGLFFILAVGAWLRAVPRARAPQLRLRPALLVALGSLAAPLLFWLSVDPSGEALAWRGPGALGLAASLALVLASAALSARAALVEQAPQRAAWLACATVLLLLSFLSKALGVTLPLVLLVLDVWPLGRLRRGSALALLVEKLPLLALSVTFGMLAIWGQAQFPDTLMNWEDHRLSERLIQALYGLFHYPMRTLVPVHLIPLVEMPHELRLFDTPFLLAGVCVFIGSALLVLRRRAAPAALVAFLAFALLIGPVLGLSQAGAQLVADRYSYLACMPFALLAAGGWLAWLSRSGRGRTPVAPLAVALLVCGASGVQTWRQTARWRNSEALWQHMSEVAPESGLPHMLLGMLRYGEGQAAEAGETQRLLEEASEHFARGFELEEHPIFIYLNAYGALLIELRRPEQARPVLERFVAARPESATGRTHLGAVYTMLGAPGLAVPQLEEALRLDPQHVKGWMHLGLAYEAVGRTPEARAAFERVLTFWPRYGPAKRKLGSLGGE